MKGSSFKKESDLKSNLPVHKRKLFTQLRISAHALNIETGRYKGLQADRRVCNQCPGNLMENEEHFMLDCSEYDNHRKILFDSLSSYNLDLLSKAERFIFLMSYSLTMAIP